MATFQIKGVDKLRKVLRKQLPDKAAKELARALNIEAEFIMRDSKRDFVPVDQDVLRSSGHVQPPVRKGNTVSVTLGYGGAASAYALAVHEHPSAHSPPSWRNGVTFNVGGPRYLKTPMDNAASGMGRRLASRINLRVR